MCFIKIFFKNIRIVKILCYFYSFNNKIYIYFGLYAIIFFYILCDGKGHTMNTKIETLIHQLLPLDNVSNPAQAGAIITDALPMILSDDTVLDGVDLTCDPEFVYTKINLYVHEGKNPWSIQALLWAPNAITPIHNHKCFCTVGMYRGVLTEHRYDSDGVFQDTVHVHRGDVVSYVPTGDDVHAFVNDTPDMAISLHIYGINGYQDNSILRMFDQVA